MTVYNYGFESGSNNDSLSSGNAGMDVAFGGGAGVISTEWAYDGTRSAKMTSTTTSGTATLAMTNGTQAGSGAAWALLIPFKIDSAWPAGSPGVTLLTFRSGSTFNLRLAVLHTAGGADDGKLRLFGPSDAVLWSSDGGFPTDFEGYLTIYATRHASTAVVQFQVLDAAGAPVSGFSASLTNQNTGSSAWTNWRLGASAGTGTQAYGPFWVDAITFDNAATGLLLPPAEPPVATVTDNLAFITATDGEPPYSISQDSGDSFTPLEATVDSVDGWIVAKHATDTRVYIVTDDDATESDPIEVPPIPSGGVVEWPKRPVGSLPTTDWG